jgi:hypothetical protein
MAPFLIPYGAAVRLGAIGDNILKNQTREIRLLPLENLYSIQSCELHLLFARAVPYCILFKPLFTEAFKERFKRCLIGCTTACFIH